jgi:glycosyltransferase involved in cell wall biosynthesis
LVKIAMLSHLASSSAPTGAERVLEVIARGLADRDHRVAVSAPGAWAFDASLAEAGVDLRPIPVRCCWLVQADHQPVWKQALRAARYLVPDPGAKALESFLLEIEPDVVYVNCLPHLRGAAAARASGRPVVWHLHEIMPPGPRRRWFADRLRRHADKIVAVSEAVAAWLREEGLEAALDVVHNGVEIPKHLPDRKSAREVFGLPAGATVFGLFSQLVPHKGAIDFVRAAHEMSEKFSDPWFLVAGDGPTAFAARLQRTIAGGPAAERIRVVPPQPEIWQLMAAVDVLALTTLWPDPLPRVVMEAMAVGRPVVAYGGGGVPEMVVDGETGLLCVPGDVAGLSSAMGRLAADEELQRQMGESGERRARELFSVERHLDRMEAVLQAAALLRG